MFRTFKPVIDYKKCTRCDVCATFCPMAAISLVEKKPKIDYSKCDGCLICLRECSAAAISEVREES